MALIDRAPAAPRRSSLLRVSSASTISSKRLSKSLMSLTRSSWSGRGRGRLWSGHRLTLRLSHHVHVLLGPPQPDLRARGGQPLALLLVCIRHEHGQRGLVGQAYPPLRGRAEVQRALEHALHARPVAARRARGLDLKL